MIIHTQNATSIGLQLGEYKPTLLFRNHHFNTMFPYGFRVRQSVPYVRKRHSTIDGDFVDLDRIEKGSNRCLILLHGLEGSSSSQYILGLVDALKHTDIDICAMNHRSCSGEINLRKTMYHSGYIDDLSEVIASLSLQYDHIHLAGYSLGGSMVLNYLGRKKDIPSSVKSAVCFSVPTDLTSSAEKLNHWKNRPYAIQFLSTLNQKIIAKATQFPKELNVNDYKKIKTLIEYDDKVTAPLHGFSSASDYYTRASAKPFLKNIAVPTLLVNALDDSFLAPPCHPYESAEEHPYFHFLACKYGGHVGFGHFGKGAYWSDNLVKEWLDYSFLSQPKTS